MTKTNAKEVGTLSLALLGVTVVGYLILKALWTEGHAAFNTTNAGVHWGLPIVIYDYFLLTSTGLAMIASLAILSGSETFRPIIKRAAWLALAGLAGGVVVLMLELGHPLRALVTIPTSFAFTSPLYWKAMAIGLYVLSLVLLIARMLKAEWDPAALRGHAILTLVLALFITAAAGAVYGSNSFRPFWASGDIPVAFIFESLLGGLAFIYFFTYLAYAFDTAAMPQGIKRLFNGPLPGLFALAIFVHLLFVLARMVNGLYGNVEGLQVWQHTAASPLFLIEVMLGLALPLVLMLVAATRTKPWAQVIAALLVMNALLLSRYEYIIGGQLVPMFKGAWAPELINYLPSPTEWLLLLLAIMVSNALNAFGELTLDLGRERAHA
jgi:Ni/Fe-hydrogenase subunit HybB-like protein